MIGEEMVFYRAELRMFDLKMFFGDVRWKAFSLAGLWKCFFQAGLRKCFFQIGLASSILEASARIHYLQVSVIVVNSSILPDLSEQDGVFLSDFAV